MFLFKVFFFFTEIPCRRTRSIMNYPSINLVSVSSLFLPASRNRSDTADGDVIMLPGGRFGIRYDRRDCGKPNSLTLFRGSTWAIDRGTDRRWFDHAFRIAEAIPELSGRGVSAGACNVLVSPVADPRDKKRSRAPRAKRRVCKSV